MGSPCLGNTLKANWMNGGMDKGVGDEIHIEILKVQASVFFLLLTVVLLTSNAIVICLVPSVPDSYLFTLSLSWSVEFSL